MRTILRAALAALFLAAPAAARAAEEPADHPLITRYPGATVARKIEKEYDAYKLITGLDEKKLNPVGRELEGKVTILHYRNPPNRSILEMFRNYEQGLQAAGMEEIWRCAGDECGPAYAASAWGRFNGDIARSGPDNRYLAGKVAGPEGEAYVAVTVGPHRTVVAVVEMKPMEEGLVVVDAAALASGLKAEGHVRVDGIYFDFNKAEVKPESRPALEQVAAMLKAEPETKAFVVGHTDGVGALDFNLKLSRDRAAAVVKALATDHGVAAARLEAQGVGPLAPVATNATEAGRAKNRRVELVAR